MTLVGDWLQGLGMGAYADVFDQAAVDLDVLPALTEQHLEGLGIPLGHRLKILDAAKRLRENQARPETSFAAASQATPEVPAADAERRQLTVAFCDVVGSTALSRKLDPEQLRELMRTYQAMCRGVVERYAGHVAQYLGDGVMIYFGWPEAHEDDAERAVRASLDIIAAVRGIQAPEPMAVRIGVATGQVVVGGAATSDGSDPRLAVGETPNLAARLQGLAGPNEVVIAPGTHRLAGAVFDYRDLGEHALKGIVEPVRAWRVLGLRSVTGRFEASHEAGISALVGRTSELALLLDRWERATAGEGQAVLLSAEPGVGKSRLARALRERIEHEPHTRLRYQCSPFHTGSMLYPVIEQFEYAAGFARDDAAQTRLDKMEALLEQSAQDVAEVAPFFAAMLTLPVDRYPASRLSPQQHKEHTIRALVAQVLGLAGKQPVLFVFEDAHWADPTTVEVLGTLLDSIESARVLVVMTYRPEFTPLWIGQPRVTALALSRLARREAVQLAEKVSGKRLPPEVLDQIVAKTDGVPLFVEELTKSVLESGLVRDAGDRFDLTGPLGPLAIPSTLHDSLMARLDRLASVRDVVQTGAAIGREFSHALIAAVCALPAEELRAALDRLVGSELISRRGRPPEASYVFKHALVQDAAYQSLLKSRRQQLHVRIAQAIERGFPDVAAAQPGLLAMHFEGAGLPRVAVEWHIKAGMLAKARSADREGIGHFEHALRLLPGLPDPTERDSIELEVRIQLGMLHCFTEGWTSATMRSHFDRANELCGQHGSTRHRLSISIGRANALTWEGRFAEASDIAKELQRVAERTADRVERLYADELRSRCEMLKGNTRAALEIAEAVIGAYDKQADHGLSFEYGYDACASALTTAAYMTWGLGFPDRAIDLADRCLDLARSLGHAATLAWALCFPAADLAWFMRRADRVLRFAEEGEQLADRCGFVLHRAVCALHRQWALARSGATEDRIERIAAALKVMTDLGVAARFAPRFTAEVASVYGEAGRADEGLAVLASSPDRRPGGRKVRFPEISRIEGDLHLLKANPDAAAAEQCYREAVQIAIDDQSVSWQLRAATSLAKLWVAQGRPGQARDLLQPLYSCFTEGFTLPDLIEARQLLDAIGAGVAQRAGVSN